MINSDMEPIILQKKVETLSPTGAKKYSWEDDRTIQVALYLTNDMKYTQSVQYNESSHTGLTRSKDIDKHNNRLRQDDAIYTISKVNLKGRLTTLLLKVVDTNV